MKCEPTTKVHFLNYSVIWYFLVFTASKTPLCPFSCFSSWALSYSQTILWKVSGLLALSTWFSPSNTNVVTTAHSGRVIQTMALSLISRTTPFFTPILFEKNILGYKIYLLQVFKSRWVSTNNALSWLVWNKYSISDLWLLRMSSSICNHLTSLSSRF